jgi:phosphoserine phosphatase
MTSTSPPPPALTAAELISSVLALRPRLAVFDCDGTLWEGDAGKDFLYWEVEHGVLPPPVAAAVIPRYRDYEAGRVPEDVMCGEMVQIHAGLPVADLERAGEEFFATLVYPRIFPEMMDLVARLAETGCELWAVSSTNEWVVRAGARRFGIPGDRILAASVRSRDGRATDELVRVPTDDGKVTAIREVIGCVPDAVFGNSLHDFDMMEMARAAFAIAPNSGLEAAARQRAWPVFRPELLRQEPSPRWTRSSHEGSS